jgi:glycosyltransferase involved in cell wall biosynthesis
MESTEAADVDVSVILPVYNEAGHVLTEVARISAALEASEYTYEIIVVDDGSTDGSGEELQEVEGIRLIRFRPRAGRRVDRRRPHLSERTHT